MERDLFRFSLQTITSCKTCNRCTITNESHYLLPLELDLKGKNFLEKLADLVTVELDCDSRGCTSKLSWRSENIVEVASVFVLQIKRFETFHGISRKLHTVFAHEQKIHVAECDFLLHAVVLHRGTTLSEGHYSAFAFRFGKWWLCSDMKIMSVSESAVLKPSKESYLLFYKRVGL